MTWSGQRTIAIVSACMKSDGTPAFALNEVTVTKEQAENGIHYYLAEAQLLLDGLQEPFVHFDEDEAPAFLHPAVRQHLGLAPHAITPPEAFACSVSSK
jgi:hypothetical protein